MNLIVRKNILGILIFYCLAEILFFTPIFVDLQILKLISWAVQVLILLTIIPLARIRSKNLKFFKLIKYLFFSLILSFFTSYLFHNQSFSFSLRVALPQISVLIYFFYVKYEVTPEVLEKLMRYMTYLFCLVYIIALIAAPKILFDPSGGDLQSLNMQRGIARIKLLGIGFVHFGFFYNINKYLVNKKLPNLIAFLLLFVFILLTVSRQHIAAALILGLLMFLQNVKLLYKIFVAISSYILIQIVINSSEIVQKMLKLSQEQFYNEGADYIRIKAYEFYMNYNSDIGQILFGNGIYHQESSWGKSIMNIGLKYGYWLSDIGFVKWYMFFGTIGIALIIWINIKVYKIRIPKDYLYLKYFIGFIMVTTIASHTLFFELLQFITALYIIDFVAKTNWNKRSIKFN